MRRATRNVLINGSPLDHVMSVDYSFDVSRVPTATVRIRGRAPSNVSYDRPIRIEAGFNGVNSVVYSGKVKQVDLDGPDTVIGCMGYSAALDVPYHKVVKTFTNITDQQAVTDLLEDAGLDNYIVNMPTPYWTIGTIVTPTLTFNTYGEAVNKVADPNGGAWFEFPSGTVVVARVDPIPSFTASREYFSKQISGIESTYPVGITDAISVDGTTYPTLPHIRQSRADQQIREVKNQIWVRGASVNVAQGDGTVQAVALELDASAPSPFVLNPDGSQAYNDLLYAHELIDTLAQAAITIARLLGLLNRLNYKTSLTIDFDPDVSLCATYRIEDPDYTGLTGNHFVTGYTTSMSETDAVTTLRLTGGSTAGGQGNISPFPFFVYTVEREVIGDREWAIITFNGLLSVDFDGTIVSYAWSDNQALVSGTTAVITVRVDPATVTSPWNVTLTVTDNDGATGVQTIPINLTPGSANVFVPGIFVAFGNYASASPDGGGTWNDQAVPGGKTYVAVGALPRGTDSPGTAVFGTGQGDLYLTTDYCASALTQVLTGVSSGFVHIVGDRNNLTHIYALTADGRIYRSLSKGAAGTWELYENLRTKIAIPALVTNRIALPLSGGGPTGGIWVYGGSGTGLPVIAIDAARNHFWTQAAIGGELAFDLGVGGGGSGGAAGLGVAQGSYVGNGTTQAITGVGFAPKAVIIKGNAASDADALFRSDAMPGAMVMRATAGLDQEISSLDADGFSVQAIVGLRPDVNAAGVTYYWQAFGGANVATGSYVGDEVVGRQIPVGFQPALVWAKQPDSATTTPFRTSSTPTNTCRSFGVQDPDRAITAFYASGFVLSDEHPNEAGDTAYWIAFKESANLATGTYAGNSTDNRSLPSPAMPFSPNLVTIKSIDEATEAEWKSSSLAGDASLQYRTNAAAANRIQSLTPAAGQFQIGTATEVNFSTWSYEWFAFQTLAAVAPGTGPADLFIYEAASLEAGELAIILNSATYQPSVYYTDDIHGDGSRWRRAINLPAKSRGRYIGPDMQVGKFMFMYDDTAAYTGDVTDGVMATAVTTGVLQANDGANHGVAIGDFIRGIGGVYIIAAEGAVDGTIWKTWDRGATFAKLRPATGYAAALAGMNAEQIALSDSGNVTLDNLIMANSPLATTATYKMSTMELTSAWSFLSQSAEVSQPVIHWIRRLGSNLFRFRKYQDLGVSHGKPCWGELDRSTDGGVTWAQVGPLTSGAGVTTWGVTDAAVGADGTLWLCASALQSAAVGANSQVWKSTDAGANWTKVYDDAQSSGAGPYWYSMLNIVCHPTNKDIVVMIGTRNNAICQYWKTSNATGAFTVTTAQAIGLNQHLSWAHETVMLTSTRLVSISGQQVEISDDYGANWYNPVTEPTGTTYGWRIIRGASDILFFSKGNVNNSEIWRSTDGGINWALVSDDFGSGATLFTEAANCNSLLYDSAQDRLYLGFLGAAGAASPPGQMVFMIPNASRLVLPVPTNEIFDLTLNAFTLQTSSSGTEETPAFGGGLTK